MTKSYQEIQLDALSPGMLFKLTPESDTTYLYTEPTVYTEPIFVCIQTGVINTFNDGQKIVYVPYSYKIVCQDEEGNAINTNETQLDIIIEGLEQDLARGIEYLDLKISEGQDILDENGPEYYSHIKDITQARYNLYKMAKEIRPNLKG